MFDISKFAYALYKQDWVDTHTTPEVRLQSIREYYAYVAECIELEDEPDTYEDWLFETGFRGSLYVCYDEFLDAEYLDEEYIRSLLGEDAILLSMYRQDLGAYGERVDYVHGLEVVLRSASERSGATIGPQDGDVEFEL